MALLIYVFDKKVNEEEDVTELMQWNNIGSTIMVTSSVQGEGKSVIASNLALVFASQGKRVLLVDADLRRPTLHKKFNLPNNNGLSSFLIGTIPALSVILDKPYNKNLYILTSGVIPPNPAELLASQRMEDLMVKLKAQFDLIIIDSPPVTAVSDAQILASRVDGTLFVVRKGVAKKHNLLRSKELMENVQARVIGTVFNGKKSEKESDYTLYREKQHTYS
ncbi:CpsD/CapB family tyrosine-protein kinase [Alkalibacterium sp. MB6]|uniref:CpsD/CapB family tyrosine-protein kinase n=1 Tax=Alkalibacterium sp. MB6 TaxID=2081965 RepID=UPI001379E8F4|nr:CpsD/CapB family tyrosine-protein kinase [Alkalibacterium sp. MB6]